MIVLKTRRQRIEQLAFSPDGRGLAAGGQQGAWRWEAITGGEPPVRFGEHECTGLGFAPDGRRLVIQFRPPGFVGHGFAVIDLAGATEFIPIPGLRYGGRLAVCPATGAVLVGGWIDQFLGCWRAGPGGLGPAWVVDPGPGVADPAPVFGPDGSWCVRPGHRAGRGNTLVIRRVTTGEIVREVPVRGWVQCGPAVSPDGRLLAYGSYHFVVVQRTDGTDERAELANDSTRQFTGVAFHPSGRYLAATSNDETVKLYDTETWQLAKTFTWGVGRLRSVAFSPDGTLAAAGSDSGKVVVWDVDV